MSSATQSVISSMRNGSRLSGSITTGQWSLIGCFYSSSGIPQRRIEMSGYVHIRCPIILRYLLSSFLDTPSALSRAISFCSSMNLPFASCR